MYLMIGLGKIGLPVANQLATLGHSVLAISRTNKSDLSKKIEFLAKDARQLTLKDLTNYVNSIQYICITVTPSQSDVQGYQDSYWAISQNICQLADKLPQLKRVFFVSSTSVYGQNSAEIIDVETVIQPPTSATAQVLWKTEQLLQQTFADKCTIIRPSGIYGLARRRLLQLAQDIENKEKPIPENTWTNRIFDTDLVAIMVKILTEKQPLSIYLVTDNEPVPLYRVLQYLASNHLELSNQLPTTGKRLQNNLPDGWLQYATWQQGYQYILESR